MHIHMDHMYYGAAIMQIAEDESFTAINAFRNTRKKIVRYAYRVNDNVGVYLKHSHAFRATHFDGKRALVYKFGFTNDQISHLRKLSSATSAAYLGLICSTDREICCVRAPDFEVLISLHEEERKSDQYDVGVALIKGGSFRVYVPTLNHSDVPLGKPFVIPKNRFPKQLFGTAKK